jgi:hydrogenase maturation protease
MTTTKAPLLVLAIGNPSRGDDALGPLFAERAGLLLRGAIARGEVELLTDFQLQIEHALDLEGRARVVFVDASVGAVAPFELARIMPKHDTGRMTHAMSPEAVLGTYRELYGEPPPSWLLAIRGERFELGHPISERAHANLEAALTAFSRELPLSFT